MALLHLDLDALGRSQDRSAAGRSGDAPIARFSLRRHGRRPLRFEGEHLATLSAGPGECAVHLAVDLYQTTGASVVLSLALRPEAHDRGFEDCHLFDDPDALLDWLADYDPALALPCMIRIDDMDDARRMQADLIGARSALDASRAAITRLLQLLDRDAASIEPATPNH
jgi:hypothetical protein